MSNEIIFVIGINLTSFVILFFAKLVYNKYALIKDIPTSKIRSIPMGLVEIQGKLKKATDSLIAPFSKEPCLFYKYIIKEYKKHTSRDSKGNTHTTYRWDTISKKIENNIVFLEDDTGKCLIKTNDSEIDIKRDNIFYQKSSRLNLSDIFSLFTGSDDKDQKKYDIYPIEKDVSRGRVGDRKYYEYLLKEGDYLYVIGTYMPDNEVKTRNIISKGEINKLFIISDSKESKILKKLKLKFILLLILGIIILGLGILLTLKYFNII